MFGTLEFVGSVELAAPTPPPPDGPSAVLWTPDYTTAKADSTGIQTGEQTAQELNVGWVAGNVWRTCQPPFVRGVKQVSRLSIVTGSDVPGDLDDPYRPGSQSEDNAGAMKVTINPASTASDFMVTATQAAGATDTTIYVSPSDAALLQFNDIGDGMTNQTTNEHVRLTAAPNTTTGALTVVRGQESTATAISVGDQFKVATGDINNQAGWSSRTECYDRYPINGGNTVPPLWPDPVGSERWYGVSYFLPADMPLDSSSYGGSNWIDFTQWKGQFGGSPPRALGLNPDGNGGGDWVIAHDGDTLYTLGPVVLGQWNRFVFGHFWSTTKATGWTLAYLNGELVLDQTAAPTMDTNGSGYTVNATTVSGSAQVTVDVATKVTIGDTLKGTGIPNGTIVTAKSGSTLTLSAPATASGSAVALTGTHPDPIYFKNGIYRSTGWHVSHTIHIGAPLVGESKDDVWMPVSGAPTPIDPPVITDPPVNTAVPTVTGTATEGSTLLCSEGVWANEPTGYAYQWQRSADGSTWADIAGATDNGYDLTSGDVGDEIRCEVTATNADGSATAASAATGAVAAGGGGGTSTAATIVATNTGNTIPAGVQANDLLLAVFYLEPANEATGSATFGTVTAPAGWTFLPISPVECNAANITTQPDTRTYVAYKWCTGSESGSVSLGGVSADYEENNGVLLIRGATDSSGGRSGTPYLAQDTGVFNDVGSQSTFTSVSVDTTSIGPCLLLYLATNYNSTQGAAPSGWTTTGRNAGTATTLTKTQTVGEADACAPTVTDGLYTTSVLLALGGVS